MDATTALLIDAALHGDVNALEGLNNLFADLVYPGDEALADSWPNEWESTFENLRGKDWREVEGKDFDSQGGLIEGIQALGIRGFLYLLPGLVRISLTDADSRYMVGFALLTWFTASDTSLESVESQEAVMEALSPPRRNFMVRFLLALRTLEPDLCPVLVDSAIFNLNAGQITRYKFEDLQKWAAVSSGGR